MKKLVLSFLAVSMLVPSVHADGGERYRRDDKKPLSVGEFFCAVAGGTAAGVIVKNAGASDPITFLGVLVGGLIGADFCKWVSSDKNMGSQAAAFAAGLDGDMCGERKWQSNQYRGTLKILAESYHKDGSGGEVGGNNTCKRFETTIRENGGKFVGRTKAWACKNREGQWIVTKENWISLHDVKTCDGSGYSRDDGRDSVSVGDGRVVSPTPINVGRIRGHWGLENFRRHVNDYGVERTLKLAYRTCRYHERGCAFYEEVEVGVMKALSDDGRGVIIYFSPYRQLVVPIEDVGIECRATQLCYDTTVRTRDGLVGTFQYIFHDGEVVINDANRGIKRRPGDFLY